MKSLEEKKEEIFKNFPTLAKIPPDKFPQHIFIIPDGNRRFAKKHGKPAVWGHTKGFQVALNLLRFFRPLPIDAVTLWGFASDNWKRSPREINHLMRIYGLIIDRHLNEMMEYNSRFLHLGRRDRIPQKLLEKFQLAEEKTKKNTGQIVSIAVDFGGENQDLRVIEKARKLPKNEKVSEETLWKLRDGKGVIRSAQLLIRTSETRTSDVGWINGKHTVLYFLPKKLFPEITEKDVADAIYYYSETKRNEGK